ncbi:MAG: GGDEF domain-containing protein [Candidatus Goldbacteria bacterium]|nr:GGDEF domain-containing protein [Candidatus Goldiibacteriota bacterium]
MDIKTCSIEELADYILSLYKTGENRNGDFNNLIGSYLQQLWGPNIETIPGGYVVNEGPQKELKEKAYEAAHLLERNDLLVVDPEQRHGYFLNLTSSGKQKTLKQVLLERETSESEKYTDSLTGLKNRRYFDEKIKPIIEKGKDHMIVLEVDIDFFKKINDTYGHPIGDEVLKKAARIGNDVFDGNFVRYGGEEFYGIIYSDKIEALKIIIKFKDRIQNEVNKINKEISNEITCSIGVAEVSPEGSEYKSFIKTIDDRLYSSKRKGRNSITFE